MCSIVCGAVPQSQVTSALLRYPHLQRLTLHLPTPDLNLLRHFHSTQLESAPGGSSSPTGVAIVDGRLAGPSIHIATLLLLADVSSGATLLMKLDLDFRRLFGVAWPNIGCISSVTWRCRSFMLATLRLTSGGAIPARVYRLSVGVALRQPVIRRQLALRAGSIFFAWQDLSHTGHAYSAVE